MTIKIKTMWTVWAIAMLAVTGLWLGGLSDESIIRPVVGQVPLCIALTVLAWVRRSA